MRLAAALACFSTVASAQTVVVRSGEREARVELAPSRTVAVRDPTDGGKRKTFTGAPLEEALARLPAPTGADAVAVRCDDGWLSLLPLASVRRYHPVLALAPPPRGPVFLVWPNVDTPAVDTDVELTPNGWAFSVASVEWARLADFAPPGPPSTGRDLFARHCQHCHAAAGRGGVAGWDLSSPPILSYRAEAYVRGYVVDPRSKNRDGHMPAFGGKLSAREIDAVMVYLRSLR